MSKPRRALVVEDDPAVRRLVQSLFERGGWKSSDTDNVDSGLAALQERPDLVVVDLGLGKETGWPLIHKGAKDGGHVLVITGGCVDDDVWADAKLLGAGAILSKPFTEREFWAAVNRALLSTI